MKAAGKVAASVIPVQRKFGLALGRVHAAHAAMVGTFRIASGKKNAQL